MRSAIVTGFVISLAVHVGGLALWFKGSFASVDAIKTETVVPVTLAMFEAMPEPIIEAPAPPRPKVVEKPLPKPEVVKKPKPKPAPKPVKKPRPKPKPVVESVQEAVPEETHEPMVTASAPSSVMPLTTTQLAVTQRPTQVNTGLLNSIKAQYKARLKRLIESNKHYPRRAKRMGREGEVLVSFLVLADGTVRQLDVLKGSGNSALDKAALDAVQSVSGLLPFPEEIKRHSWKFTVPITYKLM